MNTHSHIVNVFQFPFIIIVLCNQGTIQVIHYEERALITCVGNEGSDQPAHWSFGARLQKKWIIEYVR